MGPLIKTAPPPGKTGGRDIETGALVITSGPPDITAGVLVMTAGVVDIETGVRVIASGVVVITAGVVVIDTGVRVIASGVSAWLKKSSRGAAMPSDVRKAFGLPGKFSVEICGLRPVCGRSPHPQGNRRKREALPHIGRRSRIPFSSLF